MNVILKDIFSGNKELMSKVKEEFLKLITDSKITSEDCIKFLKEVFG
jgi:hypothetical protein